MDRTKEHYRPFSELFGEDPSDVDQPSRVPDEKGAEADKTNSELFRNTHVRRVINCQDCLKPRCVFATKVLTTEEKAAIALVDESRLFSCGVPLFPPDSPIHKTIVVRQKLTCSSPIEAQYYSAKLVKLPAVCYCCGGCGETLVYNEHFTQLQPEFQIVRPICFLCSAEGKQPFTSHANNMAKHP